MLLDNVAFSSNTSWHAGKRRTSKTDMTRTSKTDMTRPENQAATHLHPAQLGGLQHAVHRGGFLVLVQHRRGGNIANKDMMRWTCGVELFDGGVYSSASHLPARSEKKRK